MDLPTHFMRAINYIQQLSQQVSIHVFMEGNIQRLELETSANGEDVEGIQVIQGKLLKITYEGLVCALDQSS